MAKILAIGKAVPQHAHKQADLLAFFEKSYDLQESDRRKLAILIEKSAIAQRFSILPDYSLERDAWTFLPQSKNTSFPSIEQRMDLYKQFALGLSLQSIQNCLGETFSAKSITHLITVSCTGMSAPGLDLEIMEALGLDAHIFRTSVNFMGCYAAIHALKIGQMICATHPTARVMIVATELCSLHVQESFSIESAASNLLFGDGSAAILLSNEPGHDDALQLTHFYAQVQNNGKQDMSWALSSTGFLMTLSGYVPQLIEADIESLMAKALASRSLKKEDISHWCIHPGGRKIVDVIEKQLGLTPQNTASARAVLSQYGNMSSPTILFVLQEIMARLEAGPAHVFGVAFGPGLTMETFLASRP